MLSYGQVAILVIALLCDDGFSVLISERIHRLLPIVFSDAEQVIATPSGSRHTDEASLRRTAALERRHTQGKQIRRAPTVLGYEAFAVELDSDTHPNTYGRQYTAVPADFTQSEEDVDSNGSEDDDGDGS